MEKTTRIAFGGALAIALAALATGCLKHPEKARSQLEPGWVQSEMLVMSFNLKGESGAAALDGLCIAGGFGSFLDPGSAAAIGMLPAALTDKAVTLGNASLTGAGMALLDSSARARLYEIQRSCDYIELSGDPDFNEEYPEQMYFYEEEEDEWN